MRAVNRVKTLQAGLHAIHPLLHSAYDYDYVPFTRTGCILREADYLPYRLCQLASSELVTENERIISERLSGWGISDSFACGLHGSRVSDYHRDASY